MTDSSVSKDRRRIRHRARQRLWDVSTLPRVRKCGSVVASAASGVPIILNDGRAHFGNLQSCGSVHACPVCAPKIRQARAEEIEAAVTAHLEQGGGVEFLTLTVRHYAAERLSELIDCAADGFRRVIGGRRWQADRRDFGVLGTIRSLEITVGANGWHPHLHVLVFTEKPLTAGERESLTERLYGRWARATRRMGVLPPTREHGIDVRPVTTGGAVLAEYLQKGDVADELPRAGGRRVGLELVRHDLKDGRRASETPWALLARFVDEGESLALLRWQEYEVATFGRQSLTWSAGLKARFAVAEVTDSELAEAPVGGAPVLVLSLDDWRWIKRTFGLPVLLLEAAETLPPVELVGFLASHAPPEAA